MIKFTVKGNPIPKQSYEEGKTRQGKKVRFLPQKIRDWQNKVGWKAKEVMQGKPPLEKRVGVILHFYRTNWIRVDNDNLSKAVLDGMNKIVFKDDTQALDVSISRRVDKNNPRVEITVIDQPTIDQWMTQTIPPGWEQ